MHLQFLSRWLNNRVALSALKSRGGILELGGQLLHEVVDRSLLRD